jgi:hypothetical protein
MKVCTPREALCALTALFCTAVGMSVLLELSLALFNAHALAQRRLNSEAWMLSKCLDPVFAAQLRTHTDACAKIESSARLGAWGAAWRDVSVSAQATLLGHARWLSSAPVISAFSVCLTTSLVLCLFEWSGNAPDPSHLCREA